MKEDSKVSLFTKLFQIHMNRKISLLSILLGFIFGILSLERGHGGFYYYNKLDYLIQDALSSENLYVLILYPIVSYLLFLLIIEIINNQTKPHKMKLHITILYLVIVGFCVFFFKPKPISITADQMSTLFNTHLHEMSVSIPENSELYFYIRQDGGQERRIFSTSGKAGKYVYFKRNPQSDNFTFGFVYQEGASSTVLSELIDIDQWGPSSQPNELYTFQRGQGNQLQRFTIFYKIKPNNS